MSYINRLICSPRREHYPDCKCSLLGTRFSVDGIDGLYVYRGSQSVVIYCHGNKRNICSCTYLLHTANFIDSADMVFFDYHGFGNSTDINEQYSPHRLFIDTFTVIRYISRLHPDKKIYLYGHSLGAAIAIFTTVAISSTFILSSTVPIPTEMTVPRISGMVIEGAFHTLSEVLPCQLISRWLGLDEKYQSSDDIRRITCPILFSHSSEDNVIPFEQGRRLAQSVGKEVIVLTGPHNRTQYTEEFRVKLKEFLG